MRRYKATQPVELPPGINIRVNHQQAFSRKGLLKKVGRGEYKTAHPTRFRHGEVFWIDSPSDDVLSCLEVADVFSAKKRDKKKRAKK